MNEAIRRLLKPVYGRLPIRLRRKIRALRLEYLVRKGAFDSDEPEFARLGEWLKAGDLALDVGANFGSYTLRMSALVGESGHVYAFEPVPQTFVMLVRSLAARGCRNVRALNLACSDENGFASMSIPDDPLTGENLYRATISERGTNMTSISRIRIDDLPLSFEGLRLVKVDAEGHDTQVIDGMWQTISRHLPVLITEHPTEELVARLAGLGYQCTRQSGSPNGVFIPTRRQGESVRP